MTTALLKQKTLPYPTDRLISGEELMNHPEWGHCELVRGKVLPVTPPRFEHGIITGRMAFELAAFVRRKRLGAITAADAGIYTARNPDTVRGADVAFFSNARLKKEPRPIGYSTIPPDLCVEVLSFGDRYGSVSLKVAEYLAAGVRLVWVIDPARRTAQVHAPKKQPRMLEGKDVLNGENVLPGFKLALDDLFAELD